jgi:HlyD family secretion protein
LQQATIGPVRLGRAGSLRKAIAMRAPATPTTAATPSAPTSAPTSAPADPDGALPLLVVSRAPAEDVGAPPLGAQPAWRGALRRAQWIPVAMALVATGGVVGLYFQPPGLQFVMRTLGLAPGAGTSSPIAVPAPQRVVAAPAPAAPQDVVGLGVLAPRGEVATIAPPYGAGDARIETLLVREGDLVAAGDRLAILDNAATLQTSLAVARAELASRAASLAQVRADVAASRDEARSSLARAEAAWRNAGLEYERSDALRARGALAAATLDSARTAMEQTVQDVARARATLARYDYADPDAQPDVVVAARALTGAEAGVAQAEAAVAKSVVVAPRAGTVLDILARPGEKPGAAGIMTLGDIDAMTAEVEVYQAHIRDVALGADVTLRADALPEPLNGTVARIGLSVARQSLTDPSPAANTDARVVTVYVDLTPASAAVARGFTHLQVTARIAGAAR